MNLHPAPSVQLNLTIDQLRLSGIDPVTAAGIPAELGQALRRALGDALSGIGPHAAILPDPYDEVAVRDLVADVVRRVAGERLEAGTGAPRTGMTRRTP